MRRRTLAASLLAPAGAFVLGAGGFGLPRMSGLLAGALAVSLPLVRWRDSEVSRWLARAIAALACAAGLLELLRTPAASLLASPTAPLTFFLLGLGLLLGLGRTSQPRRLSQAAAVASFHLALFQLADVLFTQRLERPPASAVGSALLSAVLLALALQLFFLHRDLGLAGVVSRDLAGAFVVRRLLPAVIFMPVLIAWVRLEGEQRGLYGRAAGIAFSSVVVAALFTSVLLWIGHLANQQEAQRRVVESKQANVGNELAHTNRFLDAVFENLPNMVFVKDARQLAFARINRAGEDMLGMRREDLLGKTDFDFFPRGEAEFFQSKDREALARGELVVIPEETIQTKHGVRWLRTKKVPVLFDGVPAYLLGISEDITQRKRDEDELRAAKQAAESTSRELEAFSYSVSHDLRAPLRSIDGFSQALLEDHADALPSDARDHLNRIRAGAQRMATLIDDLLELSRVSRGELRREQVDLTALGREVAGELQRGSLDRTVEFHAQDGLLAEGDPRLLRIALENLLGNAWKFTSRNQVAQVELGEAADVERGVRRFFVRDNGAGFDMAFAAKLFGAFQRLHAPSEFEGTGIGLATVQRIIHRHGGKLWAEAAVDQGATFFFTLAGSTSARTHP